MDLPTTEAVEGTPSYPVNCSNFTNSTLILLWHLDLAQGVSGAVSLLVCSLVLFLILLNKAYVSLLQRFLLYLTLATWLNVATVTMNKVNEHLVKYAGQSQFCITLAFFRIWTGSMFVAIALEIILLLTYRVYESLQRQLLVCKLWSKRSKASVEVIAVSLSVLIPLALSVVFLVRGWNGTMCGKNVLHIECKGKEISDLTILGAIAYLVPEVVIGICVVFVIILFCKSACQSSDSRRLNCKMIRDNLVLLAFYVVFFAFSSVDISVLLLTTTNSYDSYPIWLVYYAISFPFNRLFLLLGFLFYVYSFKKLTLGSFQILKKICCKCCRGQHPYHIVDDTSIPMQRSRSVTGGPTYRSSHPQVYPSETVTSPLYTGAFTSITRRDSSDEGEREQLISSVNFDCNNIQYESI